MRQETRSSSFLAAIAFGLAAASLMASCESRYNMATLIIEDIVDLNGTNPVVYVALSRTPDYRSEFLRYAASYDMDAPTTPAITFESIQWPRDGKADTAGEFWLFISDDNSGNEIVSNNDYVLPAMRVVLRDGQTTVIDRIRFDAMPVIPFRTILMDFSFNKYIINVFIENPALISDSSPLFLRLGTSADLSQGSGPHPHDIPIVSPELSGGFMFQTASQYALLWIDIDGSGGLNPGDWISSPDETTVPALSAINSWILWSGQVVTP
jgi:hypothetical protein